MKTAISAVLLLLASMFSVQPASAWHRGSYHAPSYSQPSGGYQQPVMKYNAPQRKWSYEKPDSVMKYNPHENKWKYADPQAQPRYNPHENKWELK